GEPESLLGQPVEPRRLVILAAIATQVVDAQVVSQDEDDVRPGLVLFRPCCTAEQHESNQDGQGSHRAHRAFLLESLGLLLDDQHCRGAGGSRSPATASRPRAPAASLGSVSPQVCGNPDLAENKVGGPVMALNADRPLLQITTFPRIGGQRTIVGPV